MTVEITPFAPRALASLSLDDLFAGIARLLGAKSVKVTIAE
jgi:hypothetical protein